jgi:uncharacterized membrane protein
LIEGVTALMFCLLAVAELPFVIRPDTCGVFPCHALLLSTLLCAGLIEYDGSRVPWRLFLPVAVVGVVVPVVWPNIAILTTPLSMASDRWACFETVAWDRLLGLMIGIFFGVLAWRSLADEKSRGLALGASCVGLLLGCVAMIAIGIGSVILIAPMWLPERVSPRTRIPSCLMLGIATFGYLLVTALFGGLAAGSLVSR